MTIGERIKYLREGRHMTQEELALKIGTTKQTIYKYENNIITNIPVVSKSQIGHKNSHTFSHTNRTK